MREWISLGLDGELSRFEQLLLEAHLERCTACRTFQELAGATTATLRAAPLLAPQRPVRVERRRRLHAIELIRPFAAAAATIVLVTGSVAVSSRPGDGRLRDAQPDVQAGAEALREFQRTKREIRLEQALGPSTRPFQRPPGISVPLTPP